MPFFPPTVQPFEKIWYEHPDSPKFQGSNHSSARLLQNVSSVYWIGHSLVGTHNPFMLQALADSDANTMAKWNFQVINGSPLRNHLRDYSSTGLAGSTITRNAILDDRWDVQLGEGYDALIMTEAVSDELGVQTHIDFNGTVATAGSFYVAATDGNPSCSVWMMETSMDQNPGIYPTLDDWYASVRGYHLNSWNSIRTDALANGHDVKMIYAGQAFADLYDEFLAGNLTGIVNFEEFFIDLIHPSDIGFYFNACVVFAYIYGKSPAGLTYSGIDDGSFGTYTAPSATLTAELQALAWTSYNTHREMI